MRVYQKTIKPLLDFIFSLISIILLSPLFIIIFLLLLIVNSGSPFFLHGRPGKDGRIFKVVKFKTMNDRKDSSGHLLPDDQRLTSIGRFLRKTSLDEIPQLFNVIKGDMSIIGPRPLLVRYLPLYNDFQKRRHEVKPGITGLAQIKGRNAISWENKFKFDIWYVDHISFTLDLKIFLISVIKVIKREGTELSGPGIHEIFKGNN